MQHPKYIDLPLTYQTYSLCANKLCETHYRAVKFLDSLSSVNAAVHVLPQKCLSGLIQAPVNYGRKLKLSTATSK